MNLSWRDTPIVRMAGSAASWFLFVLSFTLLEQVTTTVMSLGGSCASGGPYDIAVECPDNVAAFAPLSIFGGLIAVAISIFLARGFGFPLVTWAWPILFIGLGSVFMLAFIFAGDPIGLILGSMFIIMGLVPLVLELRGSWQRPFLGLRDASGRRFAEGPRARTSLLSPGEPNQEDAVQATGGKWLIALAIPIVAGYLGYLLGMSAF